MESFPPTLAPLRLLGAEFWPQTSGGEKQNKNKTHAFSMLDLRIDYVQKTTLIGDLQAPGSEKLNDVP